MCRAALAALVPILAFGVGVACARSAGAEPGEPIRADLRLQAGHYLKKGLVERARAVVRRALTLPGAQDDAELQLLAARIHLEGGDIEQALAALDQARAGEGGDAARKAADLLTELQTEHGIVRVVPRGGRGQRARLFVEAAQPLIGLSRKRAFGEVQGDLAARERSYPASIWLPWGAYRFNGVAYAHEPGGPGEVTVPFPLVGVLRAGRDPGARDVVAAFLAGIGGEVALLDPEDGERLDARVRTLLQRGPAVVFAVGEGATRAARARLPSVALVHCRTPATLDLGDSDGDPVYGVAHRALPADVLERLQSLAPGVRTLGLLHDPDHSGDRAAAAIEAGAALGIEVRGAAAGAPGAVAGALDDLGDVDAYWLMAAPALDDPAAFRTVARRALQGRRPLVAARYELARDGALMAVEPDPAAEGAAAAEVARALLWGDGPPSERTVRPSGVRWTINRKIAIMLGLDLPYGAIRQAWRVINTRPPPEIAGE